MSVRRACLVVDDDWDIREAMSDALADEGYEGVMAPDGQTALDWLRSHPPPGVVLLDWNMAPMNGSEFMAELEKEPALARVPVVLLTADARVSDKMAGRTFAGCLRKPVDLDLLFEVVGRYCNG